MNEQTLRSAAGKGSNCPSIEILSTQLAAPADDPGRVSAELHLRECAHCQTELDLLRIFEEGVIRPDEAAAVAWIGSRLLHGETSAAVQPRRLGFWEAWRRPKIALGFGGVALAVLLAVGTSIELRRDRSGFGALPEFKDQVQRSGSIQVMNNPGHFSWHAFPGAVRYELTARTVDGKVVFHNSFTAQTLAFPREVAELVRDGRLVLWDVVALDANGSEIAKSGAQRVGERNER